MRNAVILHGTPGKKEYYDPNVLSMSNLHWIPWLQAQLLKRDIPASTPEVPNSYIRDWDTWKREVERYDINADSILVAHSSGAGFFIKYLSINPTLRVGRVVFVAPFIDPRRRAEKVFFHNYETDPEMAKRTKGIVVYYSDNDDDEIQESVTLLKDRIAHITYREFHNYGHFCFEDMKTQEFPELLRAVAA